MAKRQLRQLVVYSRAAWGDEVAAHYLAELRRTIAVLHAAKGLGYKVPNRPGLARWRSNAYWLYFQRRDDDLSVINIQHEKMQPEGWPPA